MTAQLYIVVMMIVGSVATGSFVGGSAAWLCLRLFGRKRTSGRKPVAGRKPAVVGQS